MRESLASLGASFLLLAVSAPVLAQYSIQDEYLPSGWFDKFDFFTDVDPTHGFVQYANETYAQQQGFINTAATDHIYIGVDKVSTFSTSGTYGVDTGRPSVRLQSKSTYTHGLFVLSLNHMPYGCGAWPAFWTVGGTWPTKGEIDIIENVNLATNNLMSLHTSDGCTIAGDGETGNLTANDCYSDGGAHVGCSVESNSDSSFGNNFDNTGGGTYAMEWTSTYIRVWNWASGTEPADVAAEGNGDLDPSSWGTPVANFQGSCDIDSHFSQHQIIFDITFCGDWAGAAYDSSNCLQTSGLDSSGSCAAFVAQNPSAFRDTYWDINYLRVYQQAPTTSSTPSTTPLSSVTPVSLASSTSINVALGASTTETRSDSATVVVPPQTDTTTMASGATVVSTALSYTYTACVQNNVIPTDAVHYTQVASNVEDCAQWCYSDQSGGTWIGMAVENGGDCYCFDNPAVYPTTVSECTVPCASSTGEICGGTSAVDLYVLSGVYTTPTPTSAASTANSITGGSVTPTPVTSPITSAPLSTVTDPATPVGDAYFIDEWSDTARIYASATISGGSTITVDGASAVSASSFPDCIVQCDDITNNDNGFAEGFLWCIAAVYADGPDVDPSTSCTLIANPDCYDASNGLDRCTDIEQSPYYDGGDGSDPVNADFAKAVESSSNGVHVARLDPEQTTRRRKLRRQTTNGLSVVPAADNWVAYFVLADDDPTPVDPATTTSSSATSSSSTTSATSSSPDTSSFSSSTSTSSLSSSSSTSSASDITSNADTTSSAITPTTSSSSSSSSTLSSVDPDRSLSAGVLPPTSGLSGPAPTTTGSVDVIVSVIYVTTCSPAPTVAGGALLYGNSTSNSTTFFRA